MAIDPADSQALNAMAAKYKIKATYIGMTGGDALEINDAHIPLSELHTAHTETFPKLFG